MVNTSDIAEQASKRMLPRTELSLLETWRSETEGVSVTGGGWNGEIAKGREHEDVVHHGKMRSLLGEQQHSE